MTAFIARLSVKEGKQGDFERLQTELSELSHKHEPDTLVYDVIKSSEKPGSYLSHPVDSRFLNARKQNDRCPPSTASR